MSSYIPTFFWYNGLNSFRNPRIYTRKSHFFASSNKRRWRNRGGLKGLGPHTFISEGGLAPQLLNDEFCLKSLSNTISIGSIKVNRFNEKFCRIWQYFDNIICNILFVIWQYFVIVWQNTSCTVCHPAMACLSH